MAEKKVRKAPETHHLDDKFISELPRPVKGNVIYYDREVKGFAVRVTASPGATFLFCYGSRGAGGSARRMPIGKWLPASGTTRSSNVKKMRSLAAEYRTKVIARGDPYAEQKRVEHEEKAAEEEAKAAKRREEAELTVDELCNAYLAEHCATLRKSTKRAAELRINRYIRPAWGPTKAKDITKADVTKLLRPIRAAGKRAELMHVLGLVSGLFSFAIDNDDLETITDNPARGLKKKWLAKADRVQPRDRALTTQREFRAFYLATRPGHCSPMHDDEAACLRLMMLTGCRPSEAAGLPWSEVDMHARVWNKPADVEGRSKSRRADVVPLVEDAMEILQARRGNGSAYVFPSGRSRRVANGGGEGVMTENRLAGALRRAAPRLKRMGVQPFSPHDLRRTVTTGLYEIDVDSYLIKRTLNHATTGVTDTHYNKHTFMRQRRAALEGWAAYLQQTIRGEPAKVSNVVPIRGVAK